ncbi:transcription factor of the MADS box [Elasticomyces elasticus]|nr:transcription factor of the MADS box [Elasticomyces elasticus]
MASEVTDHDQQNSPSAQDDFGNGNGNGNGNSNGAAESRGIKRPRTSTANAADDDDDDDDKPGRERRKIEIKFIQDKSRRHITFSKRKAGIMKKAYELSVLTGTQVLLLVVSETGLVYTFTTPKLQPLVTKPEGKNLIQACLNAPEPASENGVEDGTAGDSPEDVHAAVPVPPPGMTRNPAMPPNYMTPEQQTQAQYLQQQQAYLQQQQQMHAAAGHYGQMPGGMRPGHGQ